MPTIHIANNIIKKLSYFIDIYDIESIFMAGDYCRSIYFGSEFIDNFDVVVPFQEQVIPIGTLFASEVLNITPIVNPNSVSIKHKVENTHIDISFQGKSVNNYTNNQEIKDWMNNNKIENVPIIHNIYGRDFTMNTMLYDIRNKKIYDPTDRAVADCHKKEVTSILPSNILTKYNPISMLTAIQLSMIYHFHLEDSLKDMIMINNRIISETTSIDRILSEIVKILKIDGVDGLSNLKRFKLDHFLKHKEIKKYIG